MYIQENDMENDNIDESEEIRNTEYSEDDQTDSDQTDDDQDTDAPQYKEYSDEYLTSALEAILFAVGESVSVDRLASALEMEKKEQMTMVTIQKIKIYAKQRKNIRRCCSVYR